MEKERTHHDDLRSSRIDSPHQIPDQIGRLLSFASRGDVDAVRKMLDDRVIRVDSADYDGRTAMHLAASEGHHEVIELLVSRGAEPNKLDRWRETPLANARLYESRYSEGSTRRLAYTKVCEILEKNGGTPYLPQTSKFEIDRTELDFKNSVRIGGGEVLLVKWRGTRVAAKVIESKKLAPGETVLKEVVKDLSVLERLRHPNIVQFLGAVTNSNPLVIVSEYLPNGDLAQILRKKGRIPEKQAVNYALDIARGMNYLHEHKPEIRGHRDFKPRNLLQDEAGHLKVQLVDFALSRLLESETEAESSIDFCKGRKVDLIGSKNVHGDGADLYMAPEVRKNLDYDKRMNIFSFGIMIHEMFEGAGVIKGQSQAVAVSRNDDHVDCRVFSARTPPKIRKLLKECWNENPDERPTFADIISRLEEMVLKRKESRWATISVVSNISASLYNRCLRWRVNRMTCHWTASIASCEETIRWASGKDRRGRIEAHRLIPPST